MTVETNKPARANDYETIFILRDNIDSDASEKAISRVTAAVESTGGKLLKLESWGKRRLAFLIGRHRKGFYVYVRYLGFLGTVPEVERSLRMLDTVLRHQTVRVGRDVELGSVNADPEDLKLRRIEITESSEDDREESFEASLGLSEGNPPPPPPPPAPEPPAEAPEARAEEPKN